MKATVSAQLSQSKGLLYSPESRQRLVTAALAMTQGTRLEASAYEKMLLDHFVKGQLTIDQVLQQLAQHPAY